MKRNLAAGWSAVSSPIIRTSTGREDDDETREERLAGIVAGIVILLQFGILCAIATLAVTRLSMTMDMMVYAQGVHLIGQGNLDPFIAGGSSPYHFRYDHGAFMSWAFAPFARFFPAPIVLDAVDAVAVAAGSWFVWLVIAMEARRLPSVTARWIVRVTGLALIVLNPWPYWANAFDYHPTGTAVVFVAGALYFGYRRSAAPCIVMIVCVALLGDVSATYGAAIGIGLLFRRGMRLAGLIGLVVSIAEFMLVTHIRPTNLGELPRAGDVYAYVLDPAQRLASSKISFGTLVMAALRHPERILSHLWLRRVNVWANVAPSGVLGCLHPLTAAVAILVLLEALLAQAGVFAQPGSQVACAYPAIALGSALVVARLLRWNPVCGKIAAALLVINVSGWAIMFAPLLTQHWMRYSTIEAKQLDTIRRAIPPDDQVFAAQGTVGAFADRHDVFFDTTRFLRWGAVEPTDIIVTPFAGLNLEEPNDLARQLKWWIFAQHAHLISSNANIWHLKLAAGPAFRRPEPDISKGSIPAWALRVSEGARVIRDSDLNSFVRGFRRPGYIVSGGISDLAPGPYRFGVRSSGSGDFLVEVYDIDSRRFLARTVINATSRVSSAFTDVDVPPTTGSRDSLKSGSFPFKYEPFDAHQGLTQVEIRIYEPQFKPLNVYDLLIDPR